MIATIDDVSSGNIYLDGNDLTEISQRNIAKFRRENLGFIFQDFNLLDTLTIHENIALALTINKTKKDHIDSNVVLPDPDGPITPTNSPFFTERLMSSIALTIFPLFP